MSRKSNDFYLCHLFVFIYTWSIIAGHSSKLHDNNISFNILSGLFCGSCLFCCWLYFTDMLWLHHSKTWCTSRHCCCLNTGNLRYVFFFFFSPPSSSFLLFICFVSSWFLLLSFSSVKNLHFTHISHIIISFSLSHAHIYNSHHTTLSHELYMDVVRFNSDEHE